LTPIQKIVQIGYGSTVSSLELQQSSPQMQRTIIAQS
jgi:hypothetical protein